MDDIAQSFLSKKLIFTVAIVTISKYLLSLYSLMGEGREGENNGSFWLVLAGLGMTTSFQLADFGQARSERVNYQKWAWRRIITSCGFMHNWIPVSLKEVIIYTTRLFDVALNFNVWFCYLASTWEFSNCGRNSG